LSRGSVRLQNWRNYCAAHQLHTRTRIVFQDFTVSLELLHGIALELLSHVTMVDVAILSPKCKQNENSLGRSLAFHLSAITIWRLVHSFL
jgi:hypothetical protein